jgi:redox-sensitive bicupin YhaK (pirin superfamily)
MSGPVPETDVEPSDPATTAHAVEVLEARPVEVGGARVMRALPRRRRTVGAWCLLDHAPAVPGAAPMAIGPHPHIGLHTVTWLLAGAVEHSDSLGNHVRIRPGELNVMTAGRGIAHAEDGRVSTEPPHVVQLWLAQPDGARDAAPRFAHHAELPRVQLGHGSATVMVGRFGSETSPARVDPAVVGVDLELDGSVELPLDPTFEHAVLVLDGAVSVDGAPVGTDELGLLGTGRHGVSVATASPARVLLLGGEPLDVELLMWWNFVARRRDEIDDATAAWAAGTDRFGPVASDLPRIAAPRPPWVRPGGD